MRKRVSLLEKYMGSCHVLVSALLVGCRGVILLDGSWILSGLGRRIKGTEPPEEKQSGPCEVQNCTNNQPHSGSLFLVRGHGPLARRFLGGRLHRRERPQADICSPGFLGF